MLELTQDFVTIVSGLPRSGTSMMMKMLEAGGIRALIDNLRAADEDNPGGYYEFEPVKQTKKDPSWLKTAPGNVVKMVYRLLYDLPADYEYRVIFMRRKLDEVLASQKVMLSRHGNSDDGIQDDQMAKLFRSQLEQFEGWIPQQANFSMLEVSYNDLLEDAQPQVEEINRFLGGRLDTDSMMPLVVNPSLYRNRR